MIHLQELLLLPYILPQPGGKFDEGKGHTLGILQVLGI
jgi:hypothetical protein